MASLSYLPDKTVDQLDPDQRAFHDELSQNLSKANDPKAPASVITPTVKTALPSGQLIGPFGIMTQYPALGRAFFAAPAALQSLAASSLSALTPRAREVAILVTGTRFEAAYENYAHELIARDAGLSEAQVRAIRAGETPVGLGRAEEVAWRIAGKLVHEKGELGREAWEEGREVLGEEGMVALVGYVGMYCWVSVVLNGFGARVPE